MRSSRIKAAFVGAVVVVALVGCGGGGASTTTTAEGTTAQSSASPEEARTDAKAVAVGLVGLKDLATQIASASGDAGKALAEGIEPLWQPIEGTVQENSQETYDAFEGAFSQLESGDAARAAEGARALAAAADAYLAKFPG